MPGKFFLAKQPLPQRRLVHWNIKELDSRKLTLPESQQVNAAAQILSELQPDFLSLNEIHYDRLRAKTLGRDNLQDFLERWDRGRHLSSLCFAPSNTGLRSLPDENGHYLQQLPDRKDPRQKLIDRSNFGLFPGQYATGFAAHVPLQKNLIVQDLLWREWQPERDLSHFEFGTLKADEIELFDKSLCVSWLEVDGKSLAFVCLHAVPAFAFGQTKSPNAARNEAQLQFLQWFLFGEPAPSQTIVKDLSSKGIVPLAKSQAFIATGDFNSPLRDPRYPGGGIIEQMLKHPRVHNRMAMIPPQDLEAGPRLQPTTSFFSEGWDYSYLPTQLDYMIVSKELNIHRLDVIFAAADRQIHALRDPDDELTPLLSALQKPGRLVSIQNARAMGRPDQVAVVSVLEDFARLRAASDHLPLVLDFSWSES